MAVTIDQDIDRLLNDTVADIDKLLDAKHVVGDSMTIGDMTIIPLVAEGFGFGTGGGGGEGEGKQRHGEGRAEGTGGGGGVRPVAVIIVNPDGVKVVPVPGAPSGLEKLGAAIGTALQKRGEEPEEAEEA